MTYCCKRGERKSKVKDEEVAMLFPIELPFLYHRTVKKKIKGKENC